MENTRKEIRSLKIASVLHRAISKILMEGKVFNKNVMVSDVKLSKDLTKADVYIVLSSLNKPIIQVADTDIQIPASRAGMASDVSEDDCDINSIVNEMNKSAWSIRKSIIRYVDLRFIPELVFKPDLGFDNFVNVNEILHNYND
ncbi:ribosome-binding factor A [Wolbachia endosymbiont of Folsomia candida]|uniref:ribosome-binding factor A n=1 Tax=Wolbachia endosymbiont of Folsomia candida TaxID=169402 RepID=UPI000A7ED7E8|nr:ribosome-binding factor A [Wolbachia endosymbiont of Folsomia candida]APR99092.1 ribosome-binding factor A [Wolbachia endosymbiont of Folsomia candida]